MKALHEYNYWGLAHHDDGTVSMVMSIGINNESLFCNLVCDTLEDDYIISSGKIGRAGLLYTLVMSRQDFIKLRLLGFAQDPFMPSAPLASSWKVDD